MTTTLRDGKTREDIMPEEAMEQPETTPENEAAKTFTQEELDKIVAERLDRERKKYADYADLKKRAEEYEKLRQSQMTEQEKLEARLAEAERQIMEREIAVAEAEQRVLKAKVAESMGLPVALAERLTGTTEEELKADAANLLEVMKAGGPPKASSKQGAPEGFGPRPETMDQRIRRAAGF